MGYIQVILMILVSATVLDFLIEDGSYFMLTIAAFMILIPIYVLMTV